MKLKSKLFIIAIFALSMGFLESAVVIYMRELLYPNGFCFPLSPIPPHLALTEIIREAATLIMLLSIALLTGRKASQKFAYFIYSFAIWDIFYYVFLKLLIDWPDSFLSWDILFLIPTTWTGPVLTPVIISMTMIFLAIIILFYAEKGKNTRLKPKEWLGLITGSLILILSFILDYSKYMSLNYPIKEWLIIRKEEIFETACNYIPYKFPWQVFILAEIIILGSILLYWRRISKQK